MKSSFSLIPLDLMMRFEPKQSWLSHDSWLHGVDHMARVFVLQELICNQLELEGEKINREALRWAAMAHDVGRLDDGIDLKHGERSAKWIKEHFSDQISPELMDIVTYIVHWHVPNDHEAPVMTNELAVLKDADGLDRVRLGDFDASFLRTSVASGLIETAKKLYEESLIHDGDQAQGSFKSVLNAALNMGLIKD